MYYADDILILADGLRIRPKALHPIGITDRSQCWGVEIVSAPEKDTPPHLLVSAFSPQNWHILFRVEVELRDRMGAMARAARVFEEHQFNILATQCAPSGHNHATWHIIGEALSRKEAADSALAESIGHFEPGRSAFDEANDLFREKLTETFSAPLLKYGRRLEEMIEQAEAAATVKEKFLHPRFVEQNTLLYKNLERFFTDGEQSHFTRVREHDLYRAVESRWLQQMAIFRSYSQARQKSSVQSIKSYASWDSPILFKYDAKKALLEPLTQDHKSKYLEVVETCAQSTELPLRAVAAFNHEEHYLRIILPERSGRRRRVAIQLDYKIKFDGQTQKSSIGLLKDIAETLDNKKIDMNYIANTLTILTEDREEGRFSLVGTLDRSVGDESGFIDKLKSSLASVDERRENVSFSDTSVDKVGAKNIFISTKFDYFNLKPDLKKAVNNLVKRYGFEPVWGDPQENKDLTGEQRKALSEEIIERILRSHVFIQIIPEKPKKQEWLLFELGIASGARLPCAISVDANRVKDYPPDVAEGWVKFKFDSRKDTRDICAEIEPAIKSLAHEAYDRDR